MAADVYIMINSGNPIHNGAAVVLKGPGPITPSGIQVNAGGSADQVDREYLYNILDNRLNHPTYY